MGDWAFRHNPPFYVDPTVYPTIPQPVTPGPHPKWTLEQLKEYRDLLKEIKEMEDKIGCPCEPNKADYIGLLNNRITSITITNPGPFGQEVPVVITYGDNNGAGG
jgi:hypothetical protein